MPTTRSASVELVERAYFGRVIDPDVDGLLALFADDATITVLHGDDPARVYRSRPGEGEQPLRGYFDGVFATFAVEGYDRFDHVVDLEAGRHACTFTVRLTGKAGTELAGQRLTLRNCNVFRFRGDLIEDVLIYYANPGD